VSLVAGSIAATLPVTASVAGTAGAVVHEAPAPAAKTTAQVAPAGSLGGAVLALVLVVGLILGLAWLARRIPGLGGTGAGHPGLRIVGALALGPRDRLVVVDVGGTQLLLGVGAGGTRTLHTLDQPLPETPARATPAFAQLLAQHLGKKTP
jgi:flagellar protein FliO/FliZ